MIGKVFNRYTVLGNVNNRVIIAHNPKAVEPWVVWWLDSDGDRTAEVTSLTVHQLLKNLLQGHFK